MADTLICFSTGSLNFKHTDPSPLHTWHFMILKFLPVKSVWYSWTPVPLQKAHSFFKAFGQTWWYAQPDRNSIDKTGIIMNNLLCKSFFTIVISSFFSLLMFRTYPAKHEYLRFYLLKSCHASMLKYFNMIAFIKTLLCHIRQNSLPDMASCRI